MAKSESQLATAKNLFGSLSRIYSDLLHCHNHDPPNESFLAALTEKHDTANATALLEKLDSEIALQNCHHNLGELRAEQRALAMKVEDRKEIMRRTSKDNIRLKHELTQISRKFDCLKRDRNQYNDQIQQMREAINNLTKRQQSITSEHERLSSARYASEQKVSKLEQQAKSCKQEISIKKQSCQQLLESIRSYRKQEGEVDHEINCLEHQRDMLIVDLKEKHAGLQQTREQSTSLRRQYDIKIKEYMKIEKQLQHELHEIKEREEEKRKNIHDQKLDLAVRHHKAETAPAKPDRPSHDSENSKQIHPLRHREINKSAKNLRSLMSSREEFERQKVHPSKTSPDSSIGLWTDTEWW